MPVNAYNSPGVTVTESTSPAVAPIIATPPGIVITGYAQGYQTQIDRIALTASGTSNLTQTGINTSSVAVTNVTQGNLKVDAGAYSIIQTSNPDQSSGTSGDETYTINRFPAPSSAPSLAAGTGGLTGTYQYAVSFLNTNGETGIGPASSTITLANQGVNLTNIPLGQPGTTPATTGRNIYRAKVSNGVVGTYYLVSTINDNTTTILNNEATSDSSASANPSPQNGIASGDTVLVQYNYTNLGYYQPTLFTNYSDAVTMYGAPFDGNGNILNPLTFAMRLAFVNGAQEVIGLATASNDVTGFTNALTNLANNTIQVRLVTVAHGDSSIHAVLAAHVNAMYTAGQYRIGVVGRDSSASPVSISTLRSYAQSYNQEDMVVISPSSFNITNPVSLTPYPVGAQYMASAILGMLAARDVSVPLTRKVVAGFAGPYELRSVNDAALDSASGLLVVDFANGVLRCRHSVTTVPNDANKREVSVVRAKYEMAHQIKDGLDSTIVGLVVPQSQAASFVQTALMGILQQLVQLNIIDSYQNVTARPQTSDPTVMQVSFEYTPLYPINNIQVAFTINTSSGEFTLTQF